MMISRFPDVTFLNTTRGGARIAGAPFVELDSLMTDRLTSRVVDEQWLEKIKPASYGLKYLLERRKRMSTSLVNLKRRLEDMDKIIAELQQHMAYRNSRQLEEDFRRLDKIFSSITRNDFYRTFVTPLNMLETAIFGNGMAQVHAETLPAERAEHVVRNFGRYVQQCKRDIKYITDVLYPYIVANINIFQNWLQDPSTLDTTAPAVQTPEIDNTFTQPEKDIL